MSIREKFDEYVSLHVFEPIYASVSVRWKDDGSVVDNLVVKLSSDYVEEEDDHIFFYAGNVGVLESLADDENKADFVVLADSVEFFEKL